MAEKNEELENILNDLGRTGEKRYINTNIYSDEDIRLFLYYRSLLVKTPELRLELEQMINANLHTLLDDLPSVFKYDKVPERKLILASWFDGEDDDTAFTRTDTRYIVPVNSGLDLNAIITFEDINISKNPLYIYISGRFGSENEEDLPKFWRLYRIHCTSLRDLLMYILKDKDLKKLGIQLE